MTETQLGRHEHSKEEPPVLYWEQLLDISPHEYGPLVVTSEQLDRLLDELGEKHPVHVSDAFAATTSRSKRIVPGAMIHSFTSGWAVRHGSPVAIVGLRSMAWDFIRPVYPDEPFCFSNTYSSSTPVDERLGLISTVRRVFDVDRRTLAIGRMNVLVQRSAARSPILATN